MQRTMRLVVGWMVMSVGLWACQGSMGTDGVDRRVRTGGSGDDGGSSDDGGSGTPPGDEPCNGLDDDRDGEVDETCFCEVGATQTCFGGDPAHRGGDGCMDGTQTCVDDGEFGRWGACEGWVDCDGGGDGCEPENPFDESSELPRCKDGADNDCDGLVDCSDPDCRVPGLTEAACYDGWDNDCDGLVDCSDPDCRVPGVTEAVCYDGWDDDCDGLVDCRDPDCRGPGLTEAVCYDGWDDDCDGRVDCADPDCMFAASCCRGRCIPGTTRWCDSPFACSWGKQECTSDGRWGACREVLERPPGCDGSYYNSTCCVRAGECCQNFPYDDSVGNCSGIAAC